MNFKGFKITKTTDVLELMFINRDILENNRKYYPSSKDFYDYEILKVDRQININVIK